MNKSVLWLANGAQRHRVLRMTLLNGCVAKCTNVMRFGLVDDHRDSASREGRDTTNGTGCSIVCRDGVSAVVERYHIDPAADEDRVGAHDAEPYCPCIRGS